MEFQYPKRLFPLHLTEIERFLWVDDRPSHPMAFVIELSFRGLIDEGALREALADAVVRHPLLISKLGKAKTKRHCWLYPDGELPSIDVGPLEKPRLCEGGEWMNLEQHVGLRCWLRMGADADGVARSVLTCQFHHVCCDGIGAYRFLGDWLAYYSAKIAGDGREAEIPPIDIKRLRGRADRCRLKTRGGDDKEIGRRTRAYAWEIMGHSATPLNPPKPASGPLPSPFPGVASHHFSQTEAAQLRDAAKELGLMLNDLLILELFATCHQWNSEHGKPKDRDRYRVMMPVDLRNQEDFETPAANVVGYTFLTRLAAELKDRQRLATSIREETAGIKHNRSGERFVEMVAAGAEVKGLLPLLAALPRTLCTVVLSNVGDPSRRFLARFERDSGRIVAGNVVLEHITGFPPMRPKSRATVSIVQYRRELSIGVRCDPHSFAIADSERMLEMYVTHLKQHLPQEATKEKFQLS